MKHGFAGILFIFLVFAFQVSNISYVHMHPDEELSYRATRGSLSDTLYYQESVQDNQAPLWFVSFWTWQQTIGDAEYTSRVMGILLTMLTLGITYRLGRCWFGEAAALGAIAVLGANHFFFTYSLDIRPYPLAIFSATLSMWAFDRWLYKPNSQRTVIYGLTVGLMMYVHYLLAFLVVAQILFVLLFQRPNRRLLGAGVAALALGFVIWLPWFPTFINQVVGLRNGELASGTARGLAGIGVSTQVTSAQTAIQFAQTATDGIVWLYALTLLVGTWTLWRNRHYWLTLFWGIGVPVTALIANLFVAVYAPRFLSHATVGLALTVGAALLSKTTRLRITMAAGFVALNLLYFPSQFPVRVPYRDLYAAISQTAREGDVLLLQDAGENDGFVQWQIAHYLPSYLQANRVDTPDVAATARRVWFVTADLFDDSVEAEFADLEPTHPVQQVIGQCDRLWCYVAQLLEAPPWTEPQTFGEQMAFWGADVDSVTDAEINTRLWWRVNQPPSLDYSIGLQLLNGAGMLVAQNDGPIQHYGVETVQTSGLQPGRLYVDFRKITLPPDLPAGEYALALTVYQSWDGVRLLLPDGVDHLVLKTITEN